MLSGRTSVKMKREVMLVGGVMGSLKVMIYCGVELELPGVGQNLQDHLDCLGNALETIGDIHASRSDFSIYALSSTNVHLLAMELFQLDAARTSGTVQ
ncbi:hypothetical protein BJ165DRAFT_1510114 [Panaeolus papilionaceus]|nr:hypothetical protein BJ165DRAFT_1510114 [Panaeolus papilionaceus]